MTPRAGDSASSPKTARFTTKQFLLARDQRADPRFLSSEGVGEIEDFMPVGVTGPDLYHQLIRRVKVVRGQMTFCLTCHPAFDYARTPRNAPQLERGGVFDGGADAGIGDDPAAQTRRAGSLRRVYVAAGSMRPVSCGKSTKGISVGLLSGTHAGNMFEITVQFWHEWLSHSRYTGRWREMVSRSALALKLLTFEPGAIVARSDL